MPQHSYPHRAEPADDPDDVASYPAAARPLLTVDQVAERLGTPTRFVRRLIAQRRIGFCRVGRYVRIGYTYDFSAYKDVFKNWEFTIGDFELLPLTRSDFVYADPPYTKRQYAAYYHLLETIAMGDQPKITGSTGLRAWEDKASDYCYRRRAPDALSELVSNLKCDHFFLS